MSYLIIFKCFQTFSKAILNSSYGPFLRNFINKFTGQNASYGHIPHIEPGESIIYIALLVKNIILLYLLSYPYYIVSHFINYLIANI